MVDHNSKSKESLNLADIHDYDIGRFLYTVHLGYLFMRLYLLVLELLVMWLLQLLMQMS